MGVLSALGEGRLSVHLKSPPIPLTNGTEWYTARTMLLAAQQVIKDLSSTGNPPTGHGSTAELLLVHSARSVDSSRDLWAMSSDGR